MESRDAVMMGKLEGTTFPQRGTHRPALVLGGGGTYGVVQAAYVHAALEAGFEPKIVVGTSVGALNGAWLALHPDQPDELLRIWRGLDRLRIVPMNPVRLAAKLVRQPLSIMPNDLVPGLLEKHLGESTFADTQLPLAVVATNLSRGAKHVFRSGPLHDAILASTAIPGVYAPVEINGDLFVDGGITASLDLATAVEMGATEILAVDLTPPPAKVRPRTALGVLKQSIGVLIHASTEAMEACVAQQLPVRVVRPDLTNHSPWRLADSAGAIASNLATARRDLAELLDRRGHLRPPLRRLASDDARAPIDLESFRQARRKAG